MEREGVTKYSARHTTRALDEARHGESVRALDAWRSVVRDVGGIGQNPARYDGVGFGNASVRVGPRTASRGSRAFLITASQTGALARVALDSVALVVRWSFRDFALESEGPLPPSSEALTHATVYDAAPNARAVLHGHLPEVFRAARALRLPTTDGRAAYGTPEMADEVARLFRETTLEVGRVFVMGGHEDGVVAFGPSLDDAGASLVRAVAAARALS